MSEQSSHTITVSVSYTIPTWSAWQHQKCVSRSRLVFLVSHLHCYGEAARLGTRFFHRLQARMEDPNQVSIYAPPHSEARFCFELGLKLRSRTHNGSPS